MSEKVTLRPVTHFGDGMLLLFMVELLGQPRPVYFCRWCQCEQPHFERAIVEAGARRTYAVCSECGEASLVVEKSAIGLEAIRADAGAYPATDRSDDYTGVKR